METLMIVITGVWILMMLISATNLVAGLRRKKSVVAASGLVSVLIPARNEEKNLPRLLDALLRSSYSDFEILVCNDHSTDSTANILRHYATLDRRIGWFNGDELPAGWTGKNFACHQLSQRASGQYLMFLDADVIPSRHLITATIARFITDRLSLLSLFPRQQMESVGERLTVPVMDWILLSLLPLPLVTVVKRSSLAAANGQFMLFDADVYRRKKWHQQVRHIAVDDITISRLVKKAGLRMAVEPGNELISCRMYTGYKQAISGFSRNVHEYFGGYTWLAILFWLLAGMAPLALLVFYPGWLTAGLWGLIVLNRMMVDLASQRRITGAVLAHPLQMIALGHMIYQRVASAAQKKTIWKDREVQL